MINAFGVSATMVANEFIDRYMVMANGEYIKVYLYLLRHSGREVSIMEIADALNTTEADVKRAISYWVRLRVLKNDPMQVQEEMNEKITIEDPVYEKTLTDRQIDDLLYSVPDQIPQNSDYERQPDKTTPQSQPVNEKERERYSIEQVKMLTGVEAFSKLLYAIQQLTEKRLSHRDCEIFAYLFDTLHMSPELLEYLVEYCVQNGHTHIRYMESVALEWYECGIKTVDQAKSKVTAFGDDIFAVMKAFGLTGRRPGDAEMEYMARWFQEWGFDRTMILEACGRTLRAIQKPSFPYANKILAGWRAYGVKTLEGIKEREEQRKEKSASIQKTVEENNAKIQSRWSDPQKNKNRFHNFDQRNTDYDKMALERLRNRLNESTDTKIDEKTSLN